MAKYEYISPAIQSMIRNEAKKIRDNAGLLEPPICHETLYEALGLKKDDVSRQQLVDTKLIETDIPKQIRGVLSVQDKQVFVLDQTNYEPRKRFIQGHEAGHWALPHHRALLFTCTQFDLAPTARKQLEQEANFFSSELNFLGEQFAERVNSSALNIRNIQRQAERYEMSVEASIRRAVEYDFRESCCLVLEEAASSETDLFNIKYSFCSVPFEEKFGKPVRRGIIKKDSGFPDFSENLTYRVTKKACFDITYKESPAVLDVWNSGYNIFALIVIK